MKTLDITNWQQFLDTISTLDQWAFRGQVVSGVPLYSSLSRRLMMLDAPAEEWALREQRTVRVFRRKAHVHIDSHSALDNTLRCLAMMQHHGAPTRLLDFTKSPFVAAFFALQAARSDCTVYALNTPALWSLAPKNFPDLTRNTINPRHNTQLETYFLSNQFPVIWFGEPDEMDSRLVAQSGLFVIPGVLNMSIGELLQGYETPESGDLLVRLNLRTEMRQEAMRELYRMNITHATLWPGLDGLAASMHQELEIVWQPLLDEASKFIHTPPSKTS
ncbi:FRG domain-containing protein [Orrella sp. 11846]|uniref:FRG domain-containing protein n=1 Tax=Orrella sp. 11846 TaxID=3409913 RepID=UPI003B595C53